MTWGCGKSTVSRIQHIIGGSNLIRFRVWGGFGVTFLTFLWINIYIIMVLVNSPSEGLLNKPKNGPNRQYLDEI